MKRTKIKLDEEKQILINMITDVSFLRQLKGIAKPELFQAGYAKTVSRWVWEYFDKTEDSPGTDIQDIYSRHRAEITDEHQSDLLADFLHNLSETYKEYKLKNVVYALHNAINYFKIRSLEQLKREIDYAISHGDPALGEKFIGDYTRVEKPHGTGIDLFEDASYIKEAFTSHDEQLFSFPGELGKSVGTFIRGDFLAFLGGPKRGKSFWMWYVARRAALMGLKAIYFSIEMTQNQMVRRAWQSFMGQPVKSGDVRLPYFETVGGGKSEIRHKIEYRDGVDINDIEKKQNEYKKMLRGAELRVEIFPAYATSLSTIKNCLDNLEYYDGFLPDVIVIDYADLLLPENKTDYRHQLNQIWATLRGWAQERNCLVVTASQTTRKGIKGDSDQMDVAEDMRKLAHVTKMLSLNQSDAEREAGIMRINTLLNRDGAVSNDQIVVLENRGIGRIYLDSCLKKNISNFEQYEPVKRKKE